MRKRDRILRGAILVCTICRHPQKEAIALAVLRDGTRRTARFFGVSRSALDRHKQHLPSALAKVHLGREAAGMSSLLVQVHELNDQFRAIAAKALTAGKYHGATEALREVRNGIEFLTKIEVISPHAGQLPASEQAKARASEVTERLRARLAKRQSVASAPVEVSFGPAGYLEKCGR